MNARDIKLGIYGGLVGGLLFGAMMAKMGVLPMIGKMVGFPSAGVGFLVHMGNSAIIGAAFAVLFSRSTRGNASGLGLGLTYGAIWWILGPLTLMPLFLGMGLGVNWSGAAAIQMLPSLVGHLVFGAALGLTYAGFRNRTVASITVPVTTTTTANRG